MPSLEFFLVAESMSADVKRNTVSIFHVFSQVRVESFPYEFGPVEVISAWISSPEEIRDRKDSQLRLLIRPTPTHPGWEFRANLTSSVKYQNYSFAFKTMPIVSAGEITFELFKDDVSVAHHRITFDGPEQ